MKNSANSTTLEDAMRIGMLPRVSREMLMDRFNMSRATAYRWVARWNAAKGIPTVPRQTQK